MSATRQRARAHASPTSGLVAASSPAASSAIGLAAAPSTATGQATSPASTDWSTVPALEQCVPSERASPCVLGVSSALLGVDGRLAAAPGRPSELLRSWVGWRARLCSRSATLGGSWRNRGSSAAGGAGRPGTARAPARGACGSRGARVHHRSHRALASIPGGCGYACAGARTLLSARRSRPSRGPSAAEAHRSRV